jgi:hypothetical protein
MQKRVANQKLATLSPELETRPRVYYRNLHRFERCFIAGSVAVASGGVVDCAPGASVTLLKNGQLVAQMLTDNYGDYKFDDLASDSGAYQLDFTYKEYQLKSTTIELVKSMSLEDIVFE